MKKKALQSVLCMTAVAVAAFAGPPASARAQDDAMTGDPKLDYRLRSARADAQQERFHDSADEIARLSVELADRITRNGAVGAEDVKALDRVRRLAKRLRSDLGGSGDPARDEMPSGMLAAAAALGDHGTAFAKLASRSSRYTVDARIIRIAGEIMVLTDILKLAVR